MVGVHQRCSQKFVSRGGAALRLEKLTEGRERGECVLGKGTASFLPLARALESAPQMLFGHIKARTERRN